MIEVEIRGKLDKEKFDELKASFERHGEHIESHEREMILLYDYPGYSHDPLERNVDIRLRKTNGECEIMVKHKVSDNNVSRRESSLKLEGDSLDTAKEIVKAFGCSKGLWMHRTKDIYMRDGIEWSLITVPGKDIYFFEAEKEAGDEADMEAIEAELEEAARSLGLVPLNGDEMREFIYMLDEVANEEITW